MRKGSQVQNIIKSSADGMARTWVMCTVMQKLRFQEHSSTLPAIQEHSRVLKIKMSNSRTIQNISGSVWSVESNYLTRRTLPRLFLFRCSRQFVCGNRLNIYLKEQSDTTIYALDERKVDESLRKLCLQVIQVLRNAFPCKFDTLHLVVMLTRCFTEAGS